MDASAGGHRAAARTPRSATGNLATEDLVWMLDGLGVRTGVDLGSLADTSRWMARLLGRAPACRVVRALGSA